MTPVDAHPMVDHRVLDLVDDGGPSGLNPQSLLNLEARSSSRKVKPLRGEGGGHGVKRTS